MDEETHYCIVYEGKYGDWYSYVRKKNIVALAKYLNERILRNRNDIVKAVYVGDDFIDIKIDAKPRLFFPTEYNSQFFLESYEDRLLEQYRLENLAV